MNTKEQGNVGVAHAIAYYTANGYEVSVPLGDNTRYDLIVDKGKLLRVQVKTTRHQNATGSMIVRLQTSGGNRSGSGKKSKLSNKDCELVFSWDLINQCGYEFPIDMVAGMATLSLKNKAEFKVHTIR